MTDLPPGLQANIDQSDAALRDLVDLSRQHKAIPCRIPVCNGRAVSDRLHETPCEDIVRLLLLAIAQLADAPQPPRPPHTDGAPGEPAEDTVVRVDTPAGPAYYLRDDSLDEPGDDDGDHWWSLVATGSPLTYAQISAGGTPVVLAPPSTPDPEKGPTS